MSTETPLADDRPMIYEDLPASVIVAMMKIGCMGVGVSGWLVDVLMRVPRPGRDVLVIVLMVAIVVPMAVRMPEPLVSVFVVVTLAGQYKKRGSHAHRRRHLLKLNALAQEQPGNSGPQEWRGAEDKLRTAGADLLRPGDVESDGGSAAQRTHPEGKPQWGQPCAAPSSFEYHGEHQSQRLPRGPSLAWSGPE